MAETEKLLTQVFLMGMIWMYMLLKIVPILFADFRKLRGKNRKSLADLHSADDTDEHDKYIS
jgi:hypothetical protein